MADLFHIKICGITRPVDARAVADAGADAVGLNFFRQSPRFVDDDQALRIVEACPQGLQKVGVFVNESSEGIRRRVDRLRLDWIQLHGDEPAASLRDLHGLPVIRAFRCRDQRLEPVQEYLAQCDTLGVQLAAVLLDAWHAEHYGGSGVTLDWGMLRGEIQQCLQLPWILAGGLRSTNVAEAIQTLRPHAVDTASGVESAPGVKDAAEIAKFVCAVRHADHRR